MRKLFRAVSVLLTVVLLLSVFAMSVAAGQENGEGQRSVFAPDGQLDKRFILLHSVAYYEYSHEQSDGSIDQDRVEIERLANLSDQELEQLARANLKSVIARKEKGEPISWDRDFVTQIAKRYYPDLHPAIAEQVAKEDENVGQRIQVSQSFEMQPSEVIVQSGIVPGSRTRDFVVTGRSALGVRLYEFVCRMHWVWDSSRITTVLPSTFGRVFDPIWHYNGIHSNMERFTSPTTYWKFVEGHFYNRVGGTILQHNYPWHDIQVHAGGTYTWRHGIRR
jgi:hypothetical protein